MSGKDRIRTGDAGDVTKTLGSAQKAHAERLWRREAAMSSWALRTSRRGGAAMYDSHFAAHWPFYRQHVAARWPRICAADIDRVAGDFEELAWLVQLHYGLSKDAADIELNGWMMAMDTWREGGSADTEQPVRRRPR